jgi:hypothetical protein
MRNYTFIAYCTFGRCDSGETEVEVELTDEEAAKLIKLGTQPEIFYNGFSRCKELEDLYTKIYNIAVDQMTKEMIDFGSEDHSDNPAWQVDDDYACGVNFPREFEDQLSEEE